MSSCEHTLNTLRYADRVKELGASDPSRQSGERHQGDQDFGDEFIEDEDERVLSPEDSDLAQLRSLNDGECSADWYQFQESVAHLQVKKNFAPGWIEIGKIRLTDHRIVVNDCRKYYQPK